jgi:hypothetical protein
MHSVTVVFGTAVAHCQAPQPGTTAVTFQSSTFSDFRQLLAREPRNRNGYGSGESEFSGSDKGSLSDCGHRAHHWRLSASQ